MRWPWTSCFWGFRNAVFWSLKTCYIPFMNATAASAKQLTIVLTALECTGNCCIILWPQLMKSSYFSRWEFHSNDQLNQMHNVDFLFIFFYYYFFTFAVTFFFLKKLKKNYSSGCHSPCCFEKNTWVVILYFLQNW